MGAAPGDVRRGQNPLFGIILYYCYSTPYSELWMRRQVMGAGVRTHFLLLYYYYYFIIIIVLLNSLLVGTLWVRPS